MKCEFFTDDSEFMKDTTSTFVENLKQQEEAEGKRLQKNKVHMKKNNQLKKEHMNQKSLGYKPKVILSK